MTIKILGALAVLGSVVFFAAVYTSGTTAKAAPGTVVSPIGPDPGPRCTTLRWPKLTAKQIHAPWLHSAADLKIAGVVLGQNYPQPVVRHDEARKHTLARYAVVKKVAEAG